MRIFFYYLLISGFVAQVIGFAVLFHFQATGASLHRYLTKGIEYLDHDSSRLRHIARFTQFALLDSRLVTDPNSALTRDADFDLPLWLGSGANALRRVTDTQYAASGQPVPSSDQYRRMTGRSHSLEVIEVDSVDALRRALKVAKPGTQIVLQPGHYRLVSPLVLAGQGSASAPMILRGSEIGTTVLEIEDGAGFVVNSAYWTLSDVIVRGHCGDSPCPWLVRVEDKADRFTARNLFVSGIKRLIEVGSVGSPPRAGLIEGVTLVDGEAVDAALGWLEHAVRRIPAARHLNAGLITLCPPNSDDPGCDAFTLPNAISRVSEGGLVLMRTGVYEQAATIEKPDVHLLAEPGARLYRAAIQGKGALVVRADVVIEGLACSHIKVADGNGCCVRQERGDVTLVGVHFHHAQMGILTGHNGGEIKILDSYIHDSGYDESGNLGHNVYVNSGTLEFSRSWSLAARNAGHEIKSRAAVTIIKDSLIASLNARDSRLVDIPNGGVLLLTGSILGEGPGSENWDLIGYGLEGAKAHTHRVTIRGNTFYVDRAQGGNLLNAKLVEDLQFRDNVIVGGHDRRPGNTYYRNRAKAGVGDYPIMKAVISDARRP